MIWAKAGCAVLVAEKVGHGERIETLPWNNQAYYSEELHDMQLGLIGQSRQGWIAWDISRAIDFLLESGYADPERIILMGGATWGAGPTAAAAGFLEDRLAATVIFNFGRVYWYTGGGWRLRNCTTNKIPDWFFCASKAPRKFVYAHEFWYEGEEGPDYPAVWVPAWPRYEKVYSLYGALDNLANAQSDGLLRLDTGHCGSIDHLARREIYPLLNRWFGIPFPSEEDQSIEIDSQYGTDRQDYPLVKYKEAQRRMPDSELVCITPAVNARIKRKALHQVALKRGKELLQYARESRAKQDPVARRQNLITGLSKALGDVEPVKDPKVEELWSKELSRATVDALIVHSDAGVFIPSFLLKPEGRKSERVPVVIGIAEGGKDRFLKNRSEEVARILEAGIAVFLPDLRGTGETSSDQYKTGSHSQLYDEIALGDTLVGKRLKDLRTLIGYLRARDDLDAKRLTLWGESFTPPNKEEIFVDELGRAPVSPQIKHWASPLGAHLALLAALYDPEIGAVAIRGGLVSYLSLLEAAFTYVPIDISVPEILRFGDIPDICAMLAPIPLFAGRLVDGRNYMLNEEDLRLTMAAAINSFEREEASQQLELRSNPEVYELISWLVGQVR
jgi:dienelactone hydrolase